MRRRIKESFNEFDKEGLADGVGDIGAPNMEDKLGSQGKDAMKPDPPAPPSNSGMAGRRPSREPRKPRQPKR